MQNSCGNCGKPVSEGDVTCTHCGVLLAAYASPSGSTTAYDFQSSEPIADAVPTPDMTEPEPAPEIEIPEEIAVVSSAPRPLFDTNVTIEELAKAAEGDHSEPLVVVSEEKIATKPVEFDVPDYAKPPKDAAPVPLVEDGDEELIARHTTPQPAQASAPSPAPTKSRKKAKKEPQRTMASSPEPEAEDDDESDQGSESWLQEAHTPSRPRSRSRRVSEVAPTVSDDRGQTEAYLRKLHAQTGYDASKAALSKPVDTRRSQPSRRGGPNRNAVQLPPTVEKNRQTIFYILVLVVFFRWMGFVGDVFTGHIESGSVAITVVLTVVAVLIYKPSSSGARR